jgi:hypothetical protein
LVAVEAAQVQLLVEALKAWYSSSLRRRTLPLP